uniref:Uncharacterized protein n=1 Tax=viral metagenome TaxID=1070528 RepID=A0A6M3KR88_9ZZZZ
MIGTIQLRMHDPSAVRRALGVLYGPDLVVEIRVLAGYERGQKRWPKPWTGYFNNSADVVSALDEIESAKGVYFTLNPVKPAFLAKAKNRIRPAGKGDSTSDDAILQRRWLLIDLDAGRLSDISASDAEKEASFALCDRVRGWLDERGWPAPIVADSGNGAHLLYRIDLPNDEASRSLIERVLKALGARFSSAEEDIAAAKAGDVVDPIPVEVDPRNFNASRICKLYGTLVCKGDATDERPHRISALVDVPEPIEIVPPDLLSELASEVDVSHPTRASPTPSPSGSFDVRSWVRDHLGGLVGEESPWQGSGVRWEFDVCPFNGAHDRREAWIGQRSSGAIVAGCQHASCTWGWAELRERFEPGCYDRARETSPRQALEPPEWMNDEPPIEDDRPVECGLLGFLRESPVVARWLGWMAQKAGKATEIRGLVPSLLIDDFDDGTALVDQVLTRPPMVSEAQQRRTKRTVERGNDQNVVDAECKIVSLVRCPTLNRSTYDIEIGYGATTATIRRLIGAELASYKTVRDRSLEAGILLPAVTAKTKGQWNILLGAALASAQVVEIDPEESAYGAIREQISDIIETADDGETEGDLRRGKALRADGCTYILPRWLVGRVRQALIDDRPTREDIMDAATSLGMRAARPVLEKDGSRPRVWAFPFAPEDAK